MILVGFGHAKRVGKDTIAEMLKTHLRKYRPDWDMRTVGFADKLKEIAHDLYGWAGLKDKDFYNTPEGAALREVVLPAIGKSPRKVWIDLGTPAIREQVYDGTWVDYALRPVVEPDVLIIPDVRFPNEATRIADLGGLSILVERPGFYPGNDVADQALAKYLGWDARVLNDGTLEELDHQAEVIAHHIITSLRTEPSPYTLQECLGMARDELQIANGNWGQAVRALACMG